MTAHIDIATRGAVRDSSPTLGQRARGFGRSAALWIVVAALILIVAIVLSMSTVRGKETRTLHWDNTDELGTAALVGILRSHGTEVSTTESFQSALEASRDPNTSVVVLNSSTVTKEYGTALTGSVAEHGSSLTLLALGYPHEYSLPIDDGYDAQAPSVQTAQPSCELPGPAKAGTVEVDSSYLRLEPAAQGTACYPIPGVRESSALVALDHGKGQIFATSTSDWYLNSELTREGHAALAVSTTATRQHVVLYYANADEFYSSDSGDSGGVFPRWLDFAVLWSAVLLIVIFIWRGRRMGRLTVEQLPIIVPAIETVRGQAGLMHRTRDFAGALTTLRSASLIRLGRRLAVPQTASALDVCRAISANTGIPPGEVERVYLSGAAHSESQLIELAQQISRIESEVRPL